MLGFYQKKIKIIFKYCCKFKYCKDVKQWNIIHMHVFLSLQGTKKTIYSNGYYL